MIPTTPKEAYRTIISIQYRERLCKDLPYLKQRLYHYVQDQGGVAYLAGYEVQADQGELQILELESPDWEQLRLELDGR